MKERKVIIYLLRHGITHGNLEHRYVGGRTDEPLCLQGQQALVQMRKELVQYLRKGEPEGKPFRIYTSPMLRAVETANILFPDEPVHMISGLREMDFGIFEGKNYEEMQKDPALKKKYQAWIDGNGEGVIEKGESKKAFQQRTVEAFYELWKEDLLVEWEVEPMIPVVICHGGTIMAIMHALTGKDYYDFQVANGEGYKLTLDYVKDKPYVLSFERICAGISV